MTRFWLIILRIICAVQLVITIYSGFFSLAALFTEGEFSYFFQALAFALLAALPIRVFMIFGNNYPNKTLERREKKNFNRVFLLNVLPISFLLAFVIRDYREAVRLSKIFVVGRPRQSSFSDYYDFIISLSMLIIHLCILYSLFLLRKQITLKPAISNLILKCTMKTFSLHSVNSSFPRASKMESIQSA